MLRTPAPLLAFAALATAATLGASKPKPGFAPALPPAAAPAHPADGAIFNVSAGYAPLIAGARAHGVGDTLSIVLVESFTSSKSAASKTQRAGNASITPPTAGPLSFLNPNALNASSGSSFNGQGNASQTSSLGGEVAVTIAEVRSNGTVVVRGEKRLSLTQGQEWIQIAGIVRLADIDPDNRVLSTKVADARIEYSGNGQVGSSAREGWLSKFFNAISPF